MANMTQPALPGTTTSPSVTLKLPVVDIKPATGKGSADVMLRVLPPFPKLKSLRGPRLDASAILGLRMMHRARHAISPPPPFHSECPHAFIDLVTNLAAGYHPQELLSQAVTQSNADRGSSMSEADLITHLARFAAKSLEIGDDEIALERRMAIIMPGIVEHKLGVVIIDDDGWLRLVKESAVGNNKCAVGEDGFFIDGTFVGENDFPEPNEVSEDFAAASESVHYKATVSKQQTGTTDPVSIGDHANVQEQVVDRAAGVPSELINGSATPIDDRKLMNGDTDTAIDDESHSLQTNTLSWTNLERTGPTIGVQSKDSVLWPLKDSNGAENHISEATSTATAPQPTQKAMSSGRERKRGVHEHEEGKDGNRGRNKIWCDEGEYMNTQAQDLHPSGKGEAASGVLKQIGHSR